MSFPLPVSWLGFKNSASETPDSSLQTAILQGNSASIEALVGEIDVNKPLPNGEMPLHFAVCKNQLEAVKSLMLLGANPELKDHQNLSAIDHTVLMRNEKALAQILGIKLGKDFNEIQELVKCKGSATYVKQLDKEIKELFAVKTVTPIAKAALFGDLTTLKSLVNTQNVNDLDAQGLAPIHYAILGNQVETVEKLLSSGSSVNMEAKGGNSLLHFAAVLGSEKMLKKLIDFGVDPNHKNAKGQTPLHIAAAKEKLSSIEFLVKAGAKPNIKDHAGMSPLSIVGSSAHQRDPLALSKAQIIMLASSILFQAGLYALEQGMVSWDVGTWGFDAASWGLTALAIITTISETQISGQYLNQFGKNAMFFVALLSMSNFPSLTMVLKTWSTCGVAYSAFEGLKKCWNNIGNRKLASFRNAVVLSANAAFSFKSFYEQSQPYLSKAKALALSYSPIEIRLELLNPANPEQALALICPDCTMGELATQGDKLWKPEYRKLSRVFHPDKHPDKQYAKEVFPLLTQAHETLVDWFKDHAVKVS